MDMADPEWHAATEETILSTLETSLDGLSDTVAADRLETHGPNTLESTDIVRPWRILLHQFTSPLIYVLIVALVITVAIDHYADAIVIAAVLVINATIGFIQEYRAENAMAALASLVSPKAQVTRAGQQRTVDSAELVPGDIVSLESGDIVPADVRLLRTTDLQIDTAILTGESVPVSRSSDPIAVDRLVADRTNMAHMGTSVASGRGIGVVVATGDRTQIGAIAGAVKATERAPTPLQTRMHAFGNYISVVILVITLGILAIGFWQGIPLVDVFLLAVATAVSAIPEGLPVVMTVALAVSVRRMAGRKAIIRRLPAVETLGSCSVIVSDKTGTITENRMTVRRIWTADGTVSVTGGGQSAVGEFHHADESIAVTAETSVHDVLRAGVMTNEGTLETQPDGTVTGVGDPTETALLVAGRKAGLHADDVLETAPRVGHRPFESDRRYAASAHRIDDDVITYVTGAPERVVEMCSSVATSASSSASSSASAASSDSSSSSSANEATSVSDQGSDTGSFDPQPTLAAAEAFARDGLRVIAMARGAGDQTTETDPSDLTFLGFVGMIDPPRQRVPEAIAACYRAGIRVLMVTGDHARTAQAVSSAVGIESDRVLTGAEIEALSDAELTERLRDTAVFARIAPAQKLRIVTLLQADDEVVAVTGDGVNDAPALKAAHIGAAMGITGTDVAKEASEMVLTDDNFATIYAAVEEGRTVFSNIRKATMFLLATGVALVLAILGAFGLAIGGVLPRDEAGLFPLLLLPAQALWLNVVNNGIQDVALAFEPGEREQFEREPYDPAEGLLSRTLIERTVVVGIVLALLALVIFWYEFTSGATLGYAQTAALTTMVVSMALFLGSCRSETRWVFGKHPLSNPLLLGGTALAIVVHIGVIHFGPTQVLLGVEPIAWESWLRILLLAPTVLIVAELHKWIRRTSEAE